MPNQSLRQLKRMLWSILSNAAERSNNVRATALLESLQAAMSFGILRSAVSVKCNLLYADWLKLESPSYSCNYLTD